MTVESDRIEQAARVAWETFSESLGHDEERWRHQRPERQERWRAIAGAVLQYAKPSEEVKRLESQLRGLRRAYEHAAAQRDKYKRRTAEWRDAAMNDGFRRDATWLATEVGHEHIKRCEVEQCDTCSGVLGIEERLNDMSEA